MALETLAAETTPARHSRSGNKRADRCVVACITNQSEDRESQGHEAPHRHPRNHTGTVRGGCSGPPDPTPGGPRNVFCGASRAGALCGWDAPTPLCVTQRPLTWVGRGAWGHSPSKAAERGVETPEGHLAPPSPSDEDVSLCPVSALHLGSAAGGQLHARLLVSGTEDTVGRHGVSTRSPETVSDPSGRQTALMFSSAPPSIPGACPPCSARPSPLGSEGAAVQGSWLSPVPGASVSSFGMKDPETTVGHLVILHQLYLKYE